MLFSSVEFLLLFLPLSVGAYYICPRRWRNGMLLGQSLLFYAWGEPTWSLLMAGVATLNFLLGRWMPRVKRPRCLLAVGVSLNLCILLFFKYADLFLGTLRLSPLGLGLPLGISFYLFQAMSYVVDVYRREIPAETNLIRFGAYLTFYPQLIAGPIVRYRDMREALSTRQETLEKIADGLRLFVVGLCKKVLLANSAGSLWNTFRTLALTEGNPLTAWVGLACFAFQIYYDFSGYSDMAVGLGRMFGFELPRNFNYPYVATSVREFWHRWHITLSTWFREYVYIPLGGSRCGKGRILLNLLVTWSLTGFWHGASWNFLLWGVYFFALLALERFAWGKVLSRMPKALQHGYLLLAVGFGWLIFAFDGSGNDLEILDAISFFITLFDASKIVNFSNNIGYELLRNLPLLIVMAVGVTSLPVERLRQLGRGHAKTSAFFCNALPIFGLLLSLAYLTRDGYNPFLYFRF